MSKSELDRVIDEIKKKSTQVSSNKIDEVDVMRGMLNDPEFSVSVYDKNSGYVGQRCPHDEAVKMIKNVIAKSTGLDSRESAVLASQYEFSKRDAIFMLNNMRDFIGVYTSTGRKMNIMQTADTEASIYTKSIEATKKYIPDKINPGKAKQITTSPYIKLIANSKCPKYKN